MNVCPRCKGPLGPTDITRCGDCEKRDMHERLAQSFAGGQSLTSDAERSMRGNYDHGGTHHPNSGMACRVVHKSEPMS